MGQEALTRNSLTRLMRTGWLGKERPLVPSSTRITKQIAGQFSLLHHTFSSRVATIEAEIAPNQWNGTTNRTQTMEESLDESLLGVLIPLEGSSRASQSATNVTDEILKEALCRDLEAFDEVFEVDDLDHRPEYCPPIKNSMCAVLYDRWPILNSSSNASQLVLHGRHLEARGHLRHPEAVALLVIRLQVQVQKPQSIYY